MRYRIVADNSGEEAALASGEFFPPAADLMMPLVKALADCLTSVLNAS